MYAFVGGHASRLRIDRGDPLLHEVDPRLRDGAVRKADSF